MSSVSMSIKEYNELRDELLLYKRVLNDMLTPQLDAWSVDWYNNNPETTISVSGFSYEKLTKESRELLSSIVEEKVRSTYSDVEGEFKIEDLFVTLGAIVHAKPEVNESEPS